MRLVLAAILCLNAFGATLLDTAPVRFEPNPQLGGKSAVKWSARGAGYAFLFTDDRTVVRTSAGSVAVSFPGARRAAFQGEQPLETRVNYFVGRDYASVQPFARLRRAAIYPGIDLVYHGTGHEIEYDFEIAPGADASRIRMRFDGANAVRLNDRGEIVLETGSGEITQHKPVVYQRDGNGELTSIESRYILGRNSTVRVRLGNYDRARALIVDPTITYQAYVSGTSIDTAVSIGHDASGKIYLAGNTFSLDFPTTGQGYQTTPPVGPEHVWVMQLDPTQGGNAILYASYVGGQSNDILKQMVVDANGVMYLTGSTDSTDYPTSAGAYNASYTSDTHPFITMLDPSQQGAAALIYSTYFGGSNNDEGDGIAVANGKIYVTGWTSSSDFPTAGNAFQPANNGGNDAWIAIFDPTQSGPASLLQSTYLGGSLDDEGHSIAVDAKGLVYVGGQTGSYDFPMASSANGNQPGFGGIADGFLTIVDFNAGVINYSTYLGGSSIEDVKRIALTASGNVALTGYTVSPDFPVTQNAYQTAMNGYSAAFISVLNPSAAPGQGLIYSTYFGGNVGEVAYDLRLDAAGRFYIGGYTLSTNLPVTGNAMYGSSVGGSVDGFVAVLDPAQPPSNALVYSSYLTGAGMQVIYGVDVDTQGTIYVIGNTTGNVFPNGTPPNSAALKTSVFVLTFQLP